MLMDHLANVKLQKEEEAWALSRQLKELNATLRESVARQQALEDELELRLGQIDELRRQQSTKHRLETLDDWKALTQQLQADRKRLEGEVEGLKGERVKLLAELRRQVLPTTEEGASSAGGGAMVPSGGAAAASGEEGTSPGALALLSSAGLGAHGGGEVGPEAAAQEALRAELAAMRQRCEQLELKNRRSELEVQRLREQVRRSDGLLQSGGRGGGGGLLYSLGSVLTLGFFSGGSSSSPKRRAQHPVLQV